MLYIWLDVNFSEMVFEVLQLWGIKSMCNRVIYGFINMRGKLKNYCLGDDRFDKRIILRIIFWSYRISRIFKICGMEIDFDIW